jgi:pyruvate dehydrogenase (quinone)
MRTAPRGQDACETRRSGAGRTWDTGTDLASVDFAAVAAALEIHARRVTDPAHVGDALAEALAHPGPALVDVVTDPNALVMPPQISAAQVQGFALAATRIVLDGGVGKMIDLARANLRNIPRP